MQAPATHTWPSEDRDFVEWHRGRPRYAVWAVALDSLPAPTVAAIGQRLAWVRTALAPWLLPGPARQPHLTLHIAGFPMPHPAAPDECGPASLQAQVGALAQRLSQPATRPPPGPLGLAVGGAFSFESAACLAVQDPAGHLAAWRQALAGADPGPDATPYVPHVTAGLYAGAWPMAEVRARLQPLAALPPIPIEPAWLDWMSYDPRHIQGPLRSHLRVGLRGGAVVGVDRP